MPKFSTASKQRLMTCHPDLQRLFNEVIKRFNCTILEGHRSKTKQNEAYRNGYSKLKYPQSKHNTSPSLAVDVAPYPIDWEDRERFLVFGGYVIGMADKMGIRLIWGGDWDADFYTHDQSFYDLPHFELKGKA